MAKIPSKDPVGLVSWLAELLGQKLPQAEAKVPTAPAPAQPSEASKLLGNLTSSEGEAQIRPEVHRPVPAQQPPSTSTPAPSQASKVADNLGTAVTAGRAAAGDPTAWIELAQKAEAKITALASKAAPGLKKAWQSETIGSAAGGVFEAGEAVAGEMGPIGEQVIGPVMKFGKIMAESVDKVRQWTDALQASNFQFAEFSTSMASVQANQERWEAQQSRRRGDRRSADAEQLSRSKQRLEEKLAPIEDAFANLKSKVGVVLIDALDKFAAGLQVLFPFLKDKNTGEDPIDFGSEATKDARRAWLETYGRPQRFN